MKMSVLNIYGQYIQQATGQIYGSIINEQGISSLANQLHAAANPNLYPTVNSVVARLFDSGQMQWNELQCNDIIARTIRGMLFIEANRMGYSIDTFAADGQFLQNVLSAPQQQFVQQPVYLQQPSYAPAPQSYAPVQTQYQQPAVQSTYAMPGGNPAGNSVAALGPSIQSSNNKEPVMQQQNHLPAHTTKSPAELYATKQEYVPPKIENFVRDSTIKSIPVIDKTDIEIEYDTAPLSAALFTRFDDALCKPVLFHVTETDFMPAFNPSESLSVDMGKISEAETMEDALDALLAISHKYPINGVVAWIDNRISHAVEMALTYRLGITINGKFASVPSYREEMDQIDNFAESQVVGSIEVLHATVLHTLKEICYDFQLAILTGSQLEALEKEVNKTPCDYIGITAHIFMLTLPWALRFTFGTNAIWTADATKSQIYDILDQAWTLSKEDLPSLLVTDISNTRYRVYRIGNPKFGGGSYHFERIGF